MARREQASYCVKAYEGITMVVKTDTMPSLSENFKTDLSAPADSYELPARSPNE